MARVTITTVFALVGATAAPAAAVVGDGPVTPYPRVELWLTPRDVFGRGDRVRVWFRSATDGYVTVFRIDTDGRIRVLFPVAPEDDNAARAGEQREIAGFIVDDYPGTGYLFAVASLDPLDYGAFVDDERWDFHTVSSNQRVRGDPYVALTDLVERLVPEDYADWSYDLVPYLVDQRNDVPASWDPWRDWCGTFRQPAYGDPLVHLVAGLPALDGLFWYPPIVEPPVVQAAGRPAPAAPAARRGGAQPAGTIAAGGRPASAKRPSPRRSPWPVATAPRAAGGGRGGSAPRPAARGGGEPRRTSAPRSGAGGTIPRTIAAGPRPHR